jgi:hypothetical protein
MGSCPHGARSPLIHGPSFVGTLSLLHCILDSAVLGLRVVVGKLLSLFRCIMDSAVLGLTPCCDLYVAAALSLEAGFALDGCDREAPSNVGLR